MFKKTGNMQDVCKKELEVILKKEAELHKLADKDIPTWKTAIIENIPDKIYDGLQVAFAKAFAYIFENGLSVIDKTYNKEELIKNYQIQDYAIHTKPTSKELRKIRHNVEKNNILNSAITTAEGAALGALGIGMPDIVIFIGVLLRGIYESSLQYGYDYDSPRERMFILKMIEVSLAKKNDWARLNAGVDKLIANNRNPYDYEIKAQIQKTSDMLAMDMLLMKFIQGLPIIGIIGGLSNPIYYNKVMKYVQLKYYKRYIYNLCETTKK